MTRLIDGVFRLLEGIMVVCITLMLAMVFGNAALRVGFNTGIDISEELPRFLFIWLTFIGAVVAMRDKAHLGVDSLVRALPLPWRKLCWAVSQVLMLVCALFIVAGTWLQHEINAGSVSTVMRLPMIWVYGVTYFTGLGVALFCVINLARFARGRVGEEELVQVEEEGMLEARATLEAAGKK